MTLRFDDTISDLTGRLVGRNSDSSVRYAHRSLLTVAHQSCRRSATRLAFACAVAIMPRIALGDPILARSPTVIVDTSSSSTGHAFFVEANGIYEDVFSAQGWYNPYFGGQHGNGTGVDPSQWYDNAVWIPWTDSHRPRMNGFFNYADGSGRFPLGTPWITPTSNFLMPWQFNWATMTPPDDKGFFVGSGFGWNDGPTGRLNIFGMTLPARRYVYVGSPSGAGNGIRELWWDGGQWNWTDHGRPPGTDTMALDRNSAAWDHMSQQGRVFFAAVNSSDPQSLPQLWDMFWDGSQWLWEQLGNPFDQVVEMWPPVVVDGVQNGTYVLTAFVVGLHVIFRNSANPQYRYELYLREKIGTGAWSDWIPLGNPTINAPFTDRSGAGGTRFLIDQGVRWTDGNLLRGSLFGSTQFSNIAPDANRLIRLLHDNNGWQWDTPVLLPQPKEGGNWISSRVSCAVLTNVSGYPGWHLTALMRDSNGTIWNREYESSGATWRQSWQ
jgi:hypothetical protein